MDEREEKGLEDRRPVPVRAAMESSEPEAQDEAPQLRRFLDSDSHQEWVARVSGRSNSGVLPLRVIPLMEVTFSKAEAPDVPLSRAISQGETLEELDDNSLVALLRSSGPIESKTPSKDRPRGNDGRGRSQKRGPRR